MLRLTTALLLPLLLVGCSGIATIENAPLPAEGAAQEATEGAARASRNSPDIAFYLAFSGGGTRAAALAYGVLEGLRDTQVVVDGRPGRLLDQVDTISAVSGGSFTAAYYGLHGDKTFEDFEAAFLRRDIEGELVRGLFNPLNWLRFNRRSEMAEDLYDRRVFHHATFADMRRADGPLVLINASDLSKGVRFSFIQPYFDLLCSDLSSFPVSRAVTASSAVPLLFQPVVLQNYPGCDQSRYRRILDRSLAESDSDAQRAFVANGLNSYADKRARRYIHFVDGGITDNLGLRALYEVVDLAGGAVAYSRRRQSSPPRRVLVLVVNASTQAELDIDQSRLAPSIATVVNAVTDVQLQRYSASTLHTVEQSLDQWTADLSTPDRPVTPYFVHVGINRVDKPELLHFFNRVPTSFSLTNEQVDALIAAGRQLLHQDPDFRRLLADLAHDQTGDRADDPTTGAAGGAG